MEMDELLKRLEELRDDWKNYPSTGSDFGVAMQTGVWICSVHLSDLLDLVRQTKKG